MPESMQIVIGISAVLVVYLLAMLGTGWWTKQICLAIIRELEEKGAVDAISAVDLPYTKVNYIKIGYRDYRPKALEMLLLKWEQFHQFLCLAIARPSLCAQQPLECCVREVFYTRLKPWR